MDVQERISFLGRVTFWGTISFLSLMQMGCELFQGSSHGKGNPTAPSNLTVTLTATWLDGSNRNNQKGQATLTQGSAPISWTVGPDDTVSLVVSGNNPQGVQDAQLWISKRVCRSSGNNETCTQPLVGGPVKSNPQPSTGDHPTDVSTGLYLINITNDRSGGISSVQYEITGKAVSYSNQQTMSSQLTVSWP